MLAQLFRVLQAQLVWTTARCMKPLLESSAIGWHLCRSDIESGWCIVFIYMISEVHCSNLCYSDSRARACASIHFAGILPAHIHWFAWQNTWEMLLFVQESYESTKVIDDLWIIPKWRTPPVCLYTSCWFFLILYIMILRCHWSLSDHLLEYLNWELFHPV